MDTFAVTYSSATYNDYLTGGSQLTEGENIDNSRNLQCFVEPQASVYAYNFHVTLLSTITAFCITSNSLVIYIITTDKKLLTPNNAFIFSLAISDLLYGFAFGLYNMAHVDFAQEALGKLNCLNN